MNSLVKIASISLMFILFQGCEYFNTSTISPKQVKEQSLWSENDQAPSFSECDGLEGDANAECFKNMITERLTSILAEYNFTSDTILNEEVILTLELDTEGYFSLGEFEDDADVLFQIESLSDILDEAVSALPQALPAVKTNVGVKVKTQLTLPVRIIASPQE
ncbi:hypothetical protein OAD88_00810 [Flavobacteriaceae bacterium]|jgi:hypothetical protein|nr:hypothetical protein [Flavobacteriaceae bacterium]MDB9987898.1 hypothetical protein [Flavobacteriaceae bacterium]MDC1439381.1 hypothetical protein [Flavobacteriaceae bacterium]|tara:strand:- start:3165 stop:3653 length:489 start_codon:yes stop_codon:yes gene_type:complete